VHATDDGYLYIFLEKTLKMDNTLISLCFVGNILLNFACKFVYSFNEKSLASLPIFFCDFVEKICFLFIFNVDADGISEDQKYDINSGKY
jgi:hypothetical protein